MNDKSIVPEFIADLIDQKRLALKEERLQKEEAEKRKREEIEAIGRAKYEECFQASLLKVPEYLRQYVDPSYNEPDYWRIGNGWDYPERMHLVFSIPGLAMIKFDPKDSSWKYQGASSWEQGYGYDGDPYLREPSLSFSSDQYGWNDDLEYILGLAQREMNEYQEFVAQYAAKQEEISKLEAEHFTQAQELAAQEAEKAIQREQEQAKEKAEEQALFDAIKDDAIAIHLLKAFVLLRDERSHFEQRLYDADETIYSVENRWSRRAEELRRQADDAQRRADDERSRLQSDLDDAEAKLKKAERGW